MPGKIKPPRSLHSNYQISLPVVGGIFACVVILFLGQLSWFQPVKNVFAQVYSVFIPVQRVAVEQISRPIQWVQFIRYGTAEIQALKQQLAERTTQVAEAEFLQKENQDLREQIAAFSTQKVQDQQTILTVPARVVTAGGVIGIDQGKAAGLQVGDVVFSRGYVVGRLTIVDEFFAQFTLIEQGNTPILVKNLDGKFGVLTGEKGELLLTEIPSDQEITVGEKLYTVGSVDQGIPPGLIMGEVSDVSQLPQSSVKNIRIIQPGNEQLSSLVVIRRYERKSR